MEGVIDRFEGEYAICETKDRKMINIEKARLPASAKEGDVLIISAGKIIVDMRKTKKINKEIKELTKDLWK